MTKAPWSADQVASLNAFQRSGIMHPFTYRQYELVATERGWALPGGEIIVQDWAHSQMADWSWLPRYGDLSWWIATLHATKDAPRVDDT